MSHREEDIATLKEIYEAVVWLFKKGYVVDFYDDTYGDLEALLDRFRDDKKRKQIKP